ncbi:hypothetical protein AWR27_13360 [Spirosoma montaniterrae]|uniref:Uncharacterized protein n=1 Tax=Spirosoma montaniterrae TaxID=1178516 RepID=A0A1P9WY15_9BACT|nr:hypothetical protein AWR27_13360 [Spirosoma montaniterrae]
MDLTFKGADFISRDVGIAHCGQDALVAQQLIHVTDIKARFEQVGGETVAKAVNAVYAASFPPPEKGYLNSL